MYITNGKIFTVNKYYENIVLNMIFYRRKWWYNVLVGVEEKFRGKYRVRDETRPPFFIANFPL